MITAIIVDDEVLARQTLQSMLKLFCPNIELVGEAHDVASGEKLIREKSPDVVFLDIQMPDGSGFDLLMKFENISFKFVFITAYQDYAIRLYFKTC